MQARVAVSQEILNWLMTQVQMNSLPSEVQQNIRKWITGEKIPTFNQIKRTSRATGIPLGYFFLKTPPDEDISLVDYRTVDSLTLEQPSRNLMDTIHDMEFVQEWTRNHLISEGEGEIYFVGACKNKSAHLEFADFVREILDLKEDWFTETKNVDDSFRLIRRAISNSGVVVMMNGIVGNNTHRPLDINEFRAFTMVDDYAPLIFINSNDSMNGKLFSLLHEFAHICIGENSLFNDRYSTERKVKKGETLCNAVAAEILVPQALFIREWNSKFHDKKVEEVIDLLSKHFKCGITVIARKALDQGFIDYSLYEGIARLAVKRYNDKRKQLKSENNGGGDFYRTVANRIDGRFFEMLLNSLAESKTLYTDAFRLTNLNRSTFAALTEKVRGAINE